MDVQAQKKQKKPQKWSHRLKNQVGGSAFLRFLEIFWEKTDRKFERIISEFSQDPVGPHKEKDKQCPDKILDTACFLFCMNHSE